MAKRLTKREIDSLLEVRVGSPTCLDAQDAAAGRGRKGFTHVNLRAYISPLASEITGKARFSKTAFLPTGGRSYDNALKTLVREFEAETVEKIRRVAAAQGLIPGADGTQTFLKRAEAYVAAKGVLTSRQSRDFRTMLEYSKPLHDVSLEDITVENVEACIIAARDSPRGGRWAESGDQDGTPKESVAYHLRCFIRNVLDDAVSKDIIETNPSRSKALSKAFPCPRNEDIDPFLPDEQAKLRRAICEMPNSWHRIGFLILLSCGLRPQEMLALRWCDLDLFVDEPVLHVRRAANGESGGIKETKTASGCRTVPLSSLTARVLRKWKEDRQAYALAAGLRFSERWLVCSPYPDKNACRNSLNRPWALLMASLEGEIPRRNLYQLRHSYATTLLTVGKVDIMTVSRLLGHSDPEITLKRYIAYVETYSYAAAERLMEVLDAYDDLSWYPAEGAEAFAADGGRDIMLTM